MTQLVIGAALGFIVGDCVLVGLRHLARLLRRDQLAVRFPKLSTLQSSALVGRVARHASVLAASVGAFTLAAWSVTNYLAARDAQRAVSTGPVAAPALLSNHVDGGVVDQNVGFARARLDPPGAGVADLDPYADPDFKTPRQAHHAGASRKLTEVLLQKSETKARADLLKEMQEHAQRSQYDCEAAARAAQYLKSGLDVWGFAAWQRKYYPLDRYKGATLAQCKTIEDLIDSSETNSTETVVAEGHAPARTLDP